MGGLRQRFFQRRDGGGDLRRLVALAQHRGARYRAVLELLLDHALLFGQRVQYFAGGLQLGAQRGLLDRRGHHIGAQGQVGRLNLVTLIVDRGLRAFQRAPRGAEHVRRVRHVDRGVIQREHARSRAGAGFGDLLPRRAQLAGHGRIHQAAGLRVIVFLCLAQRGFGRRHIGILLKRAAYQLVQRRRTEHRPPLGRNILPEREALGGAANAGGRRGLRRQWRRRVTVARRRRHLGGLEIRAERASAQAGGNHRRDAGPQGQPVQLLEVLVIH